MKRPCGPYTFPHKPPLPTHPGDTVAIAVAGPICAGRAWLPRVALSSSGVAVGALVAAWARNVQASVTVIVTVELYWAIEEENAVIVIVVVYFSLRHECSTAHCLCPNAHTPTCCCIRQAMFHLASSCIIWIWWAAGGKGQVAAIGLSSSPRLPFPRATSVCSLKQVERAGALFPQLFTSIPQLPYSPRRTSQLPQRHTP